MINYYEILGVRPDCTQKEIKKAFRIMARQYHPDVAKGKATLIPFELITQAYRVLSDPEARREYDKKLGIKQSNTKRREAEAKTKSYGSTTFKTTVQNEDKKSYTQIFREKLKIRTNFKDYLKKKYKVWRINHVISKFDAQLEQIYKRFKDRMSVQVDITEDTKDEVLLLIERLNSSNPALQRMVLSRLWNYKNDKRVGMALCDFLSRSSNDPEIIEEAMRLLVETGYKEAYKVIGKWIVSDNLRLACYAASVSAKLKEDIIPYLLEGLKKQGTIARICLSVIQSIGVDKIKAADILPLLKSEDPVLRLEALKVLQHFSEPEVMGTIKGVSEYDTHPAVRMWAKRIITSINA